MSLDRLVCLVGEQEWEEGVNAKQTTSVWESKTNAISSIDPVVYWLSQVRRMSNRVPICSISLVIILYYIIFSTFEGVGITFEYSSYIKVQKLFQLY